MRSFEKLLLENKAWAAEKINVDPAYFDNHSKVQSPEFLWIGCSDSRVPANEVTGTAPGEIFVHRNIANLVVNNDVNVLSVLEYAVNHLKVKHVIVCGHYGCGGVRASTGVMPGNIGQWLSHIKKVHHKHNVELERIHNEDERMDRLVELNVQQQVSNLARTEIIQNAWKDRQAPHLHGWVYRLANGILNPIMDIPPGGMLADDENL